ncbi:MAG TPA: oligosaccharide flippase family protein [Roseiflexaceae bacterium]|nr:oligosaccharide flippase family protein [Roseiflexaceae bacterium]
MQRSTLFLIGLAGLLALVGVGALLWRRLYRDDPANTTRRVLKNSAAPLAMRLVVRALDMAFFILLVRTLPGADVGPYALATLLVGQYLGTITELGLGVLLTREVARDPGAARRLFGVTLLMRWLATLLAAAPGAALLLGGYSLLGGLGLGQAVSPAGQQATWVLLLTLPFSAYSGAVTALYNAAERMEVPALIEVVTAVLGLVARLAALLLGYGIVGLAWASVGVTAATALIYLALQRRDFFPPTLGWDTTTARALLPIALPLMLNNLLNAVFFRFDTFIIQAAGGAVPVAQYDTAYKVINIAMILPPVITFAVFPVLARRAADDRAGLRTAQDRTLQALLLLGFPLAAGMSALAPDLVRLMTGAKAGDYLPGAADALAILAWFLPLSFLNGLLQYVLIAVNRQGVITRAFAAGAAFNLAANLLAVPRYGLYAAAAITILSELVLLGLFLPALREEGLVPPLVALAWRPAAAALLMGLVLLAALPLGWLAAALLATPVYAAALWLLGAFGAEERALVRRVLGQ